MSSSGLVIVSLCCLAIAVEAIRLIRENGYRPNSHYYHLGDGRYAYHFSEESLNAIYFKCVMYDSGRCRGRAIFHFPDHFVETGVHNHPPDPDFVGERHFRENVLHQVADGTFLSYQEILDQHRSDQRYTRRVRSGMTLRRLRTSMYKRRMKGYPDIPHTLRELTRALLDHPHISTSIDGRQNMYAGSVTADDGSHHVAFSTARALEFMSNVKLIQGDGTFRSRPALPESSQVFVVVTQWHNCVIPLVWILMESKTLSAYRAVFGLLKDICPGLNPDMIISDWEYPQQVAWQEAFPRADIQGCLWHLGRAFVKKVKNLRLMRYRLRYPQLLDFVRRTCAIALLPQALFNDALQVLKNEVLEVNIVVAYLLEPFFTYVQNRWLDNAFRREWMDMFNSMHRTNNACETHNRMLRKKVGAYRPNVFLFMRALATLENNAYLDVLLLARGGEARCARRLSAVTADRQLRRLSNDLEMDIFHDRDETIKNFLHRASHLFQSAFEAHVDGEAGRRQ